MPTYTVADISADLAARIDALAEHLYPQGHRDGLEWRVGSTAGEPGDSLGIHLGDGPRKGTWKDFASGDGGDPVDLVRAALDLSTIGDAVRWAKQWLGITDDAAPRRRPPPPPAAPPAPTPDDLKRLSWAQDIWKQSTPGAGTLVEAYLASRGITIPIPSTIRYHRQLRHREAARWFPGMVAAVTDLHDKLVGVHRTFLAPDASGKAFAKGSGYESKMAIGSLSGCAVHLAEAGPRIGICEGIETGLSVMQAWRGLPVWAALSVPGLLAIQLPEIVESVVILADADPPDKRGRRAGQDAARRIAKRLQAEGRKVEIAVPPVGRDWNDLLLEGAIAPHEESMA